MLGCELLAFEGGNIENGTHIKELGKFAGVVAFLFMKYSGIISNVTLGNWVMLASAPRSQKERFVIGNEN